LVAPINSAFAKLRAETFDWLVSAEGEEHLTELLLYHVLRGVFPSFLFPEESGEFAGSLVLDTFEGGTVHVSAGSGNTIFINDIRIVAEDILANNGVVHKVDTVLDPNDGR
jgi:transforming growth factor-beta-induced protein